MKLVLISILMMAVVFFLMAIRIIFQKKGTFPNSHIGGNKEMSKRGIYCATTTDKLDRKAESRIDYKRLETDVDDSMSC